MGEALCLIFICSNATSAKPLSLSPINVPGRHELGSPFIQSKNFYYLTSFCILIFSCLLLSERKIKIDWCFWWWWAWLIIILTIIIISTIFSYGFLLISFWSPISQANQVKRFFSENGKLFFILSFLFGSLSPCTFLPEWINGFWRGSTGKICRLGRIHDKKW